MQVTDIYYERKVSDNADGNRSLSMTAVVDEGEDVSEVAVQLASLVRGLLSRDIREEDHEREREREEQRLRYQARHEARLAARLREDVVASRRAPVLDAEDLDDEDDWDEDDDDDDD